MEEEVIVEKLWGAERWLYNGYDYCMKELYIEQGAKSSLHMHKIKKETFLVTFGSVKIEVGTKLLHLHVGDFVTIEPGRTTDFGLTPKWQGLWRPQPTTTTATYTGRKNRTDG